MIRESSSVRLIWSLGCGPSTGGAGGLPPGFLPVAAAVARAASLARCSAASVQSVPWRGLRSWRAPAQAWPDDPHGAPIPPGSTCHRPLRPDPRLPPAPAVRPLRPSIAPRLPGMLIGQRAVPAGIGVHFGAVQRHRAELKQPHLARHSSTRTNSASMSLRKRRRNVAMVSWSGCSFTAMNRNATE